MTNRERFELWAVMPPREWNITRSGSKDARPGQYVYHVQCAWEAWQAACPKGWQCVPNILNNEMVKAFSLETVGRWDDVTEAERVEVAEKLQSAFDAMLSAAPKPEDVE